MSDCRSCKWNDYLGTGIDTHVDCHHPTSVARGPHWQKGDPWIVNHRTGDVPVQRMLDNFQDGCPTYEAAHDR